MSKMVMAGRFVTTLPSGNIFAGRRAAHYVYPDGGGYSHFVRYIVDKDFALPAGCGDNVYLSERVFFGRWRVLEVYECHTVETWATIAEIVVEMEKKRLQFESKDK